MKVTVTFSDGGDTTIDPVFELNIDTANLLFRALMLKRIADEKYPEYNSLHEAYGILKEEVSEFEQQVFLKQAKRDQHNIDSELADIIAVCLRSSSVDILK